MSRILVVEDDRATRHLLADVIRKAGFDVTMAQDGAGAVKLARKQSFDLMLLDDVLQAGRWEIDNFFPSRL